MKVHLSPLYFLLLLGSHGSPASQLLGQELESHLFLTFPSYSFIQSCYCSLGHSVVFWNLYFHCLKEICTSACPGLSFYSSRNSTLQVFTFFLSIHLLSLHTMLSHDFLDLSFNSVSLSSDASNRSDLWTKNFKYCILCYFIKFSL